MTQKGPERIPIQEIQSDLKQIENDWLILHYRISILLVIFALVFECLLSTLVVSSDLLGTTLKMYIIKFIVVPNGLNLLWIILDTIVVHSRRVSQDGKIYTVSLVFVMICFTLFTAHSAFVSMYYLFAVAMLLTTIYASYTLTSVVTAVSVAGLTLSELFIRWDFDKVSLFESSQRMFDFLIALVILLCCGIVSSVIIYYEKKKNSAWVQKEYEREQLKKRLRFDELTGALSRRAMYDDMRDIETGADARPSVFIIADIDHFKAVNDRYGHHAGDLCLTGFVRVLRKSFGGANVYRYGGDEFCVLVNGAVVAEAVSLCETAQRNLGELRFPEYPDLHPQASFGVAAYRFGDDSAVHLFIRADKALYEAKRTRSAVCVYRLETESA